MRGALGPGLAVLAALALPFSLIGHTGGIAVAALHVEGPAGGAGAAGDGCVSPSVPIPPPVLVTQAVELLHDLDGDGLLDPGDMISYTVEVRNFSPEPLTGLRLLVLFSSALVPVVPPDTWEPVGLGEIPAMAVDLPPLAPGAKARAGFAARFRGAEDVGQVFVEGIVYGDDFALAADDPHTKASLDPAVVTVDGVAGGAGSLFPPSAVFAKRARVSAGNSRIGEVGGKVEFMVSYTSLAQGRVEILDFVPAPLRVVPRSLEPHDVEVHELGGVTFVRARFGEVAPGDRVTLRYSAVVDRPPRLPFVALHAMAVNGGMVLFSDDPLTPDTGDPTPVLFPFTHGRRSAEAWEEILREVGCAIPVIVRSVAGEEELRWAVGGVQGAAAEAGELVFLGMIRVPLGSLPKGSVLGILPFQAPLVIGEVYVPSAYDLPIFSPLAGGMGTIRSLAGALCGDLYLPVLIELPAELPPRLAGVIMDEGL